MKNSKKILLIVALLLPLSWLVLKRLSKDTDAGTTTIGIIQTASHPALDRAREGFMDELRLHFGDKVRFKYQNAEGIVSQAQSIASSFHGNSEVNLIYAIGTLAAQAIAKVEKVKPIVIAAVSDPANAGLVHPKGNLTGTSDKIPAHKQIAMLRELLPNTKQVALLYNPAEANSVAAIREMAQAAQESGLQTIEVGVQQASEVVAVTKRATSKADAILVPADNLLVSAMSTVARIAIENKKPLFVSDPPSVERGALACLGVDYERSGRQTARIALRILQNHQRPDELEIVEETDPSLYLNQETLASLRLVVPDSILERAVRVP